MLLTSMWQKLKLECYNFGMANVLHMLITKRVSTEHKRQEWCQKWGKKIYTSYRK
jgi:hypothetical protein